MHKGTKRKGTKHKGTKHKGTKHNKRNKSIRNRKRKNTRRTRTKTNTRRIRFKKNGRRTRNKKMNSPLTTRFNRIFMMRGGDSHNGAAAFPKGYTQPINNNANGLANMGAPYNVGAAGLPTGNHLPLNANVIDPPIPSNSQFGGKGKGKGRGKGRGKQRGGGMSSFISGILPNELVNIGRSMPAAVGHLADKFNGEIPSHSSHVFPTQQPHVIDIDRNVSISPVNMNEIYNAANAEVTAI